jgi:hypothetical protein
MELSLAKAIQATFTENLRSINPILDEISRFIQNLSVYLYPELHSEMRLP